MSETSCHNLETATPIDKEEEIQEKSMLDAIHNVWLGLARNWCCNGFSSSSITGDSISNFQST